MGYIERNLIPGEQVRFKTRLHTITVVFPITLGVLICLAGSYSLYQAALQRDNPDGMFKTWAAAGGALIFAGVFTIIFALLRRNATEMAVTNRRILIKSGFASRKTIEMLLSRVESVMITEPVLGRMLGYGTVVIRGTGGTPEPFEQIAKPMQFRHCVQEQIEATQRAATVIAPGPTST